MRLFLFDCHSLFLNHTNGKENGRAEYGKENGRAEYEKKNGRAEYGKENGHAEYGKENGRIDHPRIYLEKKIRVLFKPFCNNVSHTEQLSQIKTLTNIN